MVLSTGQNSLRVRAMRDPKRIDKFCDRLKAVWHTVPDWRFGQLMINILGDMKASGRDPFFPEDDEMIKYLESYFKQRGVKANE